MLLRLPAVLTLVIATAACGGGGGSGTTSPVDTTQRLGSIELSPASATVAAGSVTVLTAAARDQAGALINGATGFTFTSSVPSVAEASTSGTVLAVSAGTTTVTASLTRDGVTRTASATFTVTGVMPDRVTVTATLDNTFSPGIVAVSRGGVVSFSFLTTHNVNFLSAGAPPNIASTSGVIVERTFTAVGDFTYSCSLHGGMTGLVVVR